jgi:hypothetical protein
MCKEKEVSVKLMSTKHNFNTLTEVNTSLLNNQIYFKTAFNILFLAY